MDSQVCLRYSSGLMGERGLPKSSIFYLILTMKSNGRRILVKHSVYDYKHHTPNLREEGVHTKIVPMDHHVQEVHALLRVARGHRVQVRLVGKVCR